jgi:hypothetical protein
LEKELVDTRKKDVNKENKHQKLILPKKTEKKK